MKIAVHGYGGFGREVVPVSDPRDLPHRLSDFDLLVVRDGPFAVTGKLSTPLAGLCVPVLAAACAADANANPNVVAVITTPLIAPMLDGRLAVAVAERPDEAHGALHVALAAIMGEQRRQTIVHPTALVHPSAFVSPTGVEIGAGAEVGPFCYIGPGVVIEEGARLHARVTLGTDGFNCGVVGGRRRPYPSVGGVRIKAFANLLPGVVVSCAVFGGETVIGEEAMIDANASISHDVQIGRRATVCALASILGRAVVEDGAYIGPSAVVRNGFRVGAGAKVGMGAVVTKDVAPGVTVKGVPAAPIS